MHANGESPTIVDMPDFSIKRRSKVRGILSESSAQWVFPYRYLSLLNILGKKALSSSLRSQNWWKRPNTRSAKSWAFHFRSTSFASTPCVFSSLQLNFSPVNAFTKLVLPALESPRTKSCPWNTNWVSSATSSFLGNSRFSSISWYTSVASGESRSPSSADKCVKALSKVISSLSCTLFLRLIFSPVWKAPLAVSLALEQATSRPITKFLRRWLVANRHSWTLIGRESALLRRWLVRALYAKYVSESLSWRIDGEIRNYGFGLSGRSVPPQVDSDKLINELHS